MTSSLILSKTVGDVVEDALRKAKLIAAEQTVESNDYENGRSALNDILKFWQTKGVHLWKEKRYVLPLNVGQKTYSLGPDGANCGEEDSFYKTALATAATSGDVTLTVDSTTGMVAAPNILTSDPTDSTQDWTAGNSATLSVSSGLVVTNGAASAGYADYELETTIGQTYVVRGSYTLGTSSSCTVSVLNGTTVADTDTLSASGDFSLSITAATTTITLRVQNVSTTSGHASTVYDVEYVDNATGSYFGIVLDSGTRDWGRVLTVNSSTSVTLASGVSGDCAVDNAIFHYDTQVARPLKVFNVTYASNYTASEIPVERWSRQEYMDQTDKDSRGTVVSVYYNPTLTSGTLKVWQTASSVNNVLRFDIREPIEVYSSTSDTLSIPEEYYRALQWAVAAELAPVYGVKMDRITVLEGKARTALEDALDNDSEDASLQFVPDFS